MRHTMLLLFSLNVICLVAQNAVRLTLNSQDGIYAKGDTVRVYGQLTDTMSRPLSMTIYDGGTRYYATIKEKPEKRPVKLSQEPTLIYQGVYNSPKAVMLSVVPDGEKASPMVGFLVDPEEIRPGFKRPKDFRRYWHRQLSALRRVKPEVKLVRVNLKSQEDAKRFEAYSIDISMPEGNPVRGYLVKPRGADPHSLPIAIQVHAAGVAGSWCRATVEGALNFARRGEKGSIAIDFNAHGYPEDQPQQYYEDLEHGGPLTDYSAQPLVDREHFYFRLMYLREIRALDYVCSLPEWDGRRCLVYGESQGGGQAEAIAGLDKRITAVVANVPALTDMGGILQHRQSGWPPAYEDDALTPLGQRILPYFDGAFFLQDSRAKLFMISGLIDETCHCMDVHAAYNVARSRDKVIRPYPYRCHSGTLKPFDKEWYATIGSERERFIDDFLH